MWLNIGLTLKNYQNTYPFLFSHPKQVRTPVNRGLIFAVWISPSVIYFCPTFHYQD